MKKLKVAFDVDGTLRCNCTETCEDPNWAVVRMFNLMATSFKNLELYVWSGGGKDYAIRFAQLYGLQVAHKNCLSKFGAPHMDMCIDDIQETALADKNLIVRMK